MLNGWVCTTNLCLTSSKTASDDVWLRSVVHLVDHASPPSSSQDGRKRRESPANTDGYSWKKYAALIGRSPHPGTTSDPRYGEKVLKETGVPRSYYKCSVPGCNAKKYVEYTEDGDVAECIIKGEHNHSRSRAGARASESGGGVVRASTRRRQPKPAMLVVRVGLVVCAQRQGAHNALPQPPPIGGILSLADVAQKQLKPVAAGGF